jgi:hypothetical protein
MHCEHDVTEAPETLEHLKKTGIADRQRAWFRMTIRIDELRTMVTTLLDRLEEVHGDAIDLDVDYFWNIPPAALYDPYSEPAELTTGQLSETWHNLESVLTNADGVVLHDLVWVSDILRALGLRLLG